jgi:formylglycine-generating enzyme required for sulfatase activity
MFRQVRPVALVVLTALCSLPPATAREADDTGGQPQVPLKKVTLDLGRGVKLEMVLIPAGEFMMGTPDSEKYADDWESLPWEKPRHRVRITKPFYLGKYPVTQEQWEAVMGNNPSHFKGPTNPVECVSWADCQQFLRKLNAKSLPGGGKFRLPSEAQWEYACRAGSKTRYCFGHEASKLPEYAWYAGNAGDKTHPVGEKKPNAWGLYDMQGNVWQWCQDRFGTDYYANSPLDDPTGPSFKPTNASIESSGLRVNRGGSWRVAAVPCRSACRSRVGPNLGYYDLGLRVCRVAAGQ